jgi:hypothetical protein
MERLGARGWTAALILQMLIVVYWEVTEYVDLFPFDDVRGNHWQNSVSASLANDVPKLLILAVFWFARNQWQSKWYRFFIFSAGVYYLVYLGLQIRVWYPRYLWGATPEEAKAYAKKFGQTIKLLPTYGHHLPPDLQHNVLQLMTIAIIVVMFVLTVKLGRIRPSVRRRIVGGAHTKQKDVSDTI